MLGPVIAADEPANAASSADKNSADKTASKIENYHSDHGELSRDEVKMAIAQIDVDLDHLSQLANFAPTSSQKAEAKARYAVLMARRDELKKDFTRAQYEAFKADLQAEKDKVSVWTRDTFTAKPAASTAVSATGATVSNAAEKVADYRNEATDLNKAEAKASLARLDADIELLTTKIDAVADPSRKDELKQHLKMLKDRRGELNREFLKARYDALVDDVKAEWNKVVQSP
jgi:chromosome segregation ATPase